MFQKKVPTVVLLISRLLKHLKKGFYTFFSSPAIAESKNNNIFILGLKLEKLLTKMFEMVRIDISTPLLCRIQKYKDWYSRIEISECIIKNATWYHFCGNWMSLSHYIIKRNSFLYQSANFYPRIRLLLFLNIAWAGLLKTAQIYISRCLGSQKIGKTKVRLKLIGTTLFTISNMVFSLLFCQ